MRNLESDDEVSDEVSSGAVIPLPSPMVDESEQRNLESAVVIPEPESRPVGRPRLRDPIMDEATFPGSPTTVGSFIQDLLTLVRDGAMTHNAAERMFDTIRSHIPQPHQLPNYRHARRLLASCSSVQAKLFACCPNDCFMLPLDAIRPTSNCIFCHASLVDGKGRAKKVSLSFHIVLRIVTICYELLRFVTIRHNSHSSADACWLQMFLWFRYFNTLV
jgi:hypothetical protein